MNFAKWRKCAPVMLPGSCGLHAARAASQRDHHVVSERLTGIVSTLSGSHPLALHAFMSEYGTCWVSAEISVMIVLSAT